MNEPRRLTPRYTSIRIGRLRSRPEVAINMWEVLYIVLALLFLLLLYGLIRALLVRDRPAAPVRPLDDAALAEIDQLVQRGQKIQAIKTMRDHTALPLAQAKERIEAWDIAQERRAIGRRAAPPPTPIPDEE